jgi:hypothetical protein
VFKHPFNTQLLNTHENPIGEESLRTFAKHNLNGNPCAKNHAEDQITKNPVGNQNIVSATPLFRQAYTSQKPGLGPNIWNVRVTSRGERIMGVCGNEFGFPPNKNTKTFEFHESHNTSGPFGRPGAHLSERKPLHQNCVFCFCSALLTTSQPGKLATKTKQT